MHGNGLAITTIQFPFLSLSFVCDALETLSQVSCITASGRQQEFRIYIGRMPSMRSSVPYDVVGGALSVSINGHEQGGYHRSPAPGDADQRRCVQALKLPSLFIAKTRMAAQRRCKRE